MLWAWDRVLGDRDRVEQQMRDEERARAEPREDDAAPPSLECRVCGHAGPERFCPHCLADTMIEQKKR